MSVLTRSALEDSPLADLHAIATEIGLPGFRRLRKADLVDAILGEQGPEDGGDDAPVEEEEEEKPRRSRSRRGGRSRSRSARDADTDTDTGDDAEEADEPKAVAEEAEPEEEREARPPRSRSRGGRTRPARSDEGADGAEEAQAEGVVELLGNGSGFLRVNPPEPSDDDVYVSAAQVRRCELVSGDKVAGPVRAPRRSERYPSLVRIDTINGAPADQVAEGTPFDELPAAFPTERFGLGDDDPTLKAIEWLTPIGRGSRVSIVGAARSGKTEALRRLGAALAGQDGLEVTYVAAGIRPEELREGPDGLEPVAALPFSASADAQGQAVERAIDTARRIAARGGHAVVLIDTLDGLHASVARKALGAARAIVDGGSLTVVGTASGPLGFETTVVALDVDLTSTGRLPALDLASSGTVRPELLVGDDGAAAIAKARAEALGVVS
ncbi:MAG: transcription termination factor Rho [Solirubrobacteraceae bacterium]|nr:transcription termination factor Rho [Solirubrobacteraceae bacterium]